MSIAGGVIRASLWAGEPAVIWVRSLPGAPVIRLGEVTCAVGAPDLRRRSNERGETSCGYSQAPAATTQMRLAGEAALAGRQPNQPPLAGL